MRDGARWLMAIIAVIYLAAIGFAPLQTGILLGISLAGGFAISVIVMITSRAVPTRAWSVTIAALTALAGIVLIFTHNFWILAIGSLVGSYAASGVHWGAMTQIEQTGITRIVNDDSRTRAFSFLTIASAAGRALGALTAGLSTLLITAYDWEPTDAYRFVLAIYVAMNAAAAVLYLFLSKAPDIVSADKNSHSSSTLVLNNPFKARSRKQILTIAGLFSLDSLAGGMIFESFLSFWLFTKFGMSAAAIGALLIASQAANMLSLAMAPALARKIGLLHTLVLTQIVSNIMLIIFAFAPHALMAIVLWILRSLFDEMDVPTRQSYMMAITEPDEHPIMAGSANLGRGIGRMPSATITGMLWSGALTATPWLIAATIKIGYDIAIYAAFRNVKPPEESASTQPDH